MFGLGKLIRDLQQAWLANERAKAEISSKTTIELAAMERARWDRFLAYQEAQEDRREVGGLPKEIAKARQELEARRLSMEEEAHGLRMEQTRLAAAAAKAQAEKQLKLRMDIEEGKLPAPRMAEMMGRRMISPE